MCPRDTDNYVMYIHPKQVGRLKVAGTQWSTNENWCVTIKSEIIFYFHHTCLYILALLIPHPHHPPTSERLFQTCKCIKRKHKVIVKCHWFRQSQDEKKSLIELVFYHWSEWIFVLALWIEPFVWRLNGSSALFHFDSLTDPC